MLPSATVQSQPVNPATQAPARSEAHLENKGESFSETLSRSLGPAAETAAPAAIKTAATKPSRPAVDADKADPADLVNALLATLIPAEISVAKTPALNEAPVGTAAAAASMPAPLETVSPAALAAAGTAMAAMQGKPESDPPTAQPSVLVTLAAVSPQVSVQSKPDVSDAGLAQVPDAVTISLAAPSQGSGASNQALLADTREPEQRQPLRTESVEETDRTAFVAAMGSPNSHPAAPVSPFTGADFVAVASVAVETTMAASASSSMLAPTIDPSDASPWLIHPASGAAPGLTHLATPDVQTALRTLVLSPEVGSSEWGKALGQQMIHLGTAGQQTAELQLNPPGLGPLKVTLSLNDQQIQAIFVSAHPSVRAAVEAALPQLRSTLADSGISLGNTSVSAEGQPQTAFDDRQSRSTASSAYQSDRLTEPVATTPNPVTQGARQRHGVTVDTYA